MLVRLAFHQLDAVVDQIRVEVFDLLLRELDVLEPGDDLVVGEDALLVPSWTSFCSSSTSGREISTVSNGGTSRCFALGGRGARSTSYTRKSRYTRRLPAPLSAGGYYRVATKANSDFCGPLERISPTRSLRLFSRQGPPARRDRDRAAQGMRPPRGRARGRFRPPTSERHRLRDQRHKAILPRRPSRSSPATPASDACRSRAGHE